MNAQNYKIELKRLIETFGYWSKEVYNLNNNALESLGSIKYTRLHNQVLSELK